MKFKLMLRRLQNPRVSTRYNYANVEQFHIELRNRFTTLATPEAADPQKSVQSPSECKHSGVQMTCGERTMNSQGTDANADQQRDKLRDTILETARKTLASKRKSQQTSLTDTTLALLEEKCKCRRDSEYGVLRRKVCSAIKRDKRAKPARIDRGCLYTRKVVRILRKPVFRSRL